ncbi:hypothetical protein HMPREF1705_04733 [Acetomicrobium hydrogeniformans ATCC BAA-1850]|uniref:Uncharacterized protein n=1 Tax=Acetomicrobium hydrogeniformans ATCC BAA-1850 TaxID=592015 RepID=A0A0T5X9Z1_9BACT|nr:hypothetical protein HMPREF1705_04733 [Acetomicrobium hydrogeniformans ATCC BAA-1850]
MFLKDKVYMDILVRISIHLTEDMKIQSNGSRKTSLGASSLRIWMPPSPLSP